MEFEPRFIKMNGNTYVYRKKELKNVPRYGEISHYEATLSKVNNDLSETPLLSKKTVTNIESGGRPCNFVIRESSSGAMTKMPASKGFQGDVIIKDLGINFKGYMKDGKLCRGFIFDKFNSNSLIKPTPQTVRILKQIGKFLTKAAVSCL